MKDKTVLITVIVIMALGILIGEINLSINSDAAKFKREYESLNGEKIAGNKVRSLTISDENPFIYATAEEIVEKIENKETFAVYFGFAKCPWCRSVLPELIEVASDLEINEIYYVDVYDIRDVLELNKNNDVTISREGDKAYYQLLDKLDKVLEEYKLTTDDGEEIDTLEKRIYAPNVVAIVDGKAEDLTTGISDDQTDPYMKLTKKMKRDTYNKFKCVLECLSEKATTCSKKSC